MATTDARSAAQHGVLTPAQQDAITAIGASRRQRKAGNSWLVGEMHISQKLIAELKRLDIVDEHVIGGKSVLKLTAAGRIAAIRLRASPHQA